MPRSSPTRPLPADGGRAPSFGELLREWRTARRRSQLDLALTAEVSARHLSFLETGRAAPSREMVLLLGSALDVPLRERNALLQAAGFAPAYRETALREPAMEHMTEALRLILRQHEPFAAVALDRHWNLVMANAAYLRMLTLFLGPERMGGLAAGEVAPRPRLNTLRALFDPAGLRPHVANFEELARELVGRVRREAAWEGDAESAELLADLVRAAGLPAPGAALPSPEQAMVVPVEIRAGSQVLRFFTTITTLGAPQDITLAELRIEAFHPADAATEAAVRALAAG
ncbi:MAG TPA: helix-turn-helix transcriptional regulator [Vicinamibacteria bacterium]|jgi:transcriptional regulator with XRE-family HTH domain